MRNPSLCHCLQFLVNYWEKLFSEDSYIRQLSSQLCHLDSAVVKISCCSIFLIFIFLLEVYYSSIEGLLMLEKVFLYKDVRKAICTALVLSEKYQKS